MSENAEVAVTDSQDYRQLDAMSGSRRRRLGARNERRPGAFRLTCLAVCVLALLSPVTVLAGPAKGGDDAASGDKPGKPAARRTRGSRRISLEDDFLVEGRLEKPSAYYILSRSRLEYDWARLEAQFSPLVLESVQDPLF